MTKRIGFIGNCQLATLSRLYAQLVEADAGIEVFYIPSYRTATGEQRDRIGSADIVVRQILDFDQKIGELNVSGEVHLFPHLSGSFLWPYTGQAHPKNGVFPFFDPAGPYPTELGDSFLNRLIQEGVTADDAVKRYRETDVGTVKRLDRFKELVLDKQRARDQACGYDFAEIIEAKFRTEPLFRTPSHLEIPFTMLVASKLFERLGLDADIIAKAVANPPGGLFPLSAMPIHPSVIDKFGITYVGKDHRYRFFDEGGFTFEEFAGRYMRFEWDPVLAEGMHWFRKKDFAKAAGSLERAVVSSPRSAVARFVLSDLLSRQDRWAEAVTLAREAVALEPDILHYRERLAYFEKKQGQLPEASVLPKTPNIRIDFGRGGNAQQYQGQGWSNPEADYTWTMGKRAQLNIRHLSAATDYILSLSINPFIPAARPFQRLSIEVNDVSIADLYLEKKLDLSLCIPAGLITDNTVITFVLPNAASPADFDGHSTDTRPLGLAFGSLALNQLGPDGARVSGP